MVSNEGCLKIIDFGCSKEFKNSVNTMSKVAVSPQWAAPECFKPEIKSNKIVVSVLVDVWSLGCTIYEMVKLSPFRHYLIRILY